RRAADHAARRLLPARRAHPPPLGPAAPARWRGSPAGRPGRRAPGGRRAPPRPAHPRAGAARAAPAARQAHPRPPGPAPPPAHRPDPGPDAGEPRPVAFEDGLPAFHRTGMEIRFVDGGADRPGPARAWFRLRRPVVGDEEPSGVQRVAAAADFSNGISWVLPFADWIFLNPDLTLHLARPPAGEWIGLDAVTVPSDQGMGMAESAVYDEKGRLGRAVQSLLLQRRTP